jgi:hypothetical protein
MISHIDTELLAYRNITITLIKKFSATIRGSQGVKQVCQFLLRLFPNGLVDTITDGGSVDTAFYKTSFLERFEML